MGTNPYTAGVFYSGSFITEEFIQEFSELGIDRRLAVLAEISPRPQFSQFAMHRSVLTTPSLENLSTTYAYFYINTAGALIGQTTPKQFTTKTDQWVNCAPPPKYFIFTDENLGTRYVTCNTSGTPALSATGIKPPSSLNDAQFVGEYLEMIGENGTSIYRIAVNSSNVISVTLNRTEPERAATIRISNGHTFPFDGTNLWLEGLVTISDVQMGIDEFNGGYSGVATARVGTVHLQLVDGWFRFLIQQSWDSRDITIKIGFTDEEIGLYRVILRAKTERAEANFDELVITLRDHSIILDKSMQEDTYLASGVYEGIGDILGTLKPLAFGFVRHATPVLINEQSNVYQIHDGPIHGIFSIHVAGQLMTNVGDLNAFPSLPHLIAWFPTQAQVDLGGYMTDHDWGTFRLAAPAAGVVTVTFWGSTSVPKDNARISQVIKAIMARAAPEITIDQNSLDVFGIEQGGAAAVYLTEETSIRQVLHDLVAPVGALVSVNALNVMSVQRVRTRQPVAVLAQHNLIEDVKPSRRNPPRPGSLYRVGYFKNWTLCNATDIANSPAVNIEIFLQRVFSYVNHNWYGQGNIRLPMYSSASALEYNTLLDNAAQASQLAVFLSYRDHSLQNLYECTTVGFAFQIEIGDTVLFQVEELGTKNVKTGIVVEVVEKAITSSNEDLTQLLIWA